MHSFSNAIDYDNKIKDQYAHMARTFMVLSDMLPPPDNNTFLFNNANVNDVLCHYSYLT